MVMELWFTKTGFSQYFMVQDGQTTSLLRLIADIFKTPQLI